MDKLMNMYSKITASHEVENNLILEKDELERKLNDVNIEYKSVVSSKSLWDKKYNLIIQIMVDYINSEKSLDDISKFHSKFISIDSIKLFNTINNIDIEKLTELYEAIKDSIFDIVPDTFVSMMAGNRTKYVLAYILSVLGINTVADEDIVKISQFCAIMRSLELIDTYLVAQYASKGGTIEMYIDNIFDEFENDKS
jgi:hypothetical protein|nr:MAG TPA: hypothetical protein [Caudoviricetes sp.]